MNKPRTLFIGRRRIVVVSLFSGFDFFLLGLVKSGMTAGYAVEKSFWACQAHRSRFLHPDGTPVMECFVEITLEEYQYKRNHKNAKGQKDMEDEVGIIEGRYYRTKLIQEINGYDIRAGLEARYGKDIIIEVCGGPPCQGYTRQNTQNSKNNSDPRNSLVFEYLRILDEISQGAKNGNVLGLMEEVPDFGQGNFIEIYNNFLKEAGKLLFKHLEQSMCSIHYQGHQSRWRKIFQFVHNDFNADPVFPVADAVNIKRVKDFLDIDGFVMGSFDQLYRNNDHLMQTVTSGTPKDFFKNDIKRSPFIDELMLCQGVEKGEYPLPPEIPLQQKKKGIGNGVCVYVAMALGRSIINDVLRMKPNGDGYFIPIDKIMEEQVVAAADTDTEVDGDVNPWSIYGDDLQND